MYTLQGPWICKHILILYRKLLKKLSHYGITGLIHSWIESVLCHHHMWVTVEGASSSTTEVDSGIPQGTVLGPLLFLVFINDLPQQVSAGTTIWLLADDCLIYRQIKYPKDQDILQCDLESLEKWIKVWGMRFNPTKCTVLRSHRSQKPFTRFYSLCGEILSESSEAKYLGVVISSDLLWEKQVNAISQKASNSLNFIRRNLKYCPQQAKATVYNSLVRSTVEYCTSTWDPYYAKDINKIERVNRRAARFIVGDHSPRSSITAMLAQLGWSTLEDRRQNLRLTLMFKVVKKLVAVPPTHLDRADSRTRANHPHKFRTIRTSTELYRNSQEQYQRGISCTVISLPAQPWTVLRVGCLRLNSLLCALSPLAWYPSGNVPITDPDPDPDLLSQDPKAHLPPSPIGPILYTKVHRLPTLLFEPWTLLIFVSFFISSNMSLEMAWRADCLNEHSTMAGPPITL